MEQLAILGGTFDPVHIGHLVVAQTALSQLGLDRVIWVPTRHPPHKQSLAYEHRRSMVEKAIAGNSAFAISPLDMDRAEPDYAIATLAYLQKVYPNQQWYWIIGLDSFQTLPLWYCRERLIPSCQWIVAPRFVPVADTTTFCDRSDSSYKQQPTTSDSWLCQQVVRQLAAQNILIRWQLLQMPTLGISSSLIRQYCRQNRSIRYLVPDNVRAYITAQNLYTDGITEFQADT
ncbi:MAG TPA: nicotinate (nicotinamide) nucleotide adenylyltransferase [Chroococcales cyanobacterium]